MRALTITAEALTAAHGAYEQRCAELGIADRLPAEALAEALNLAVLVAQRVVEGRKLRLTLLVSADNLDLARATPHDCSVAAVHVALPDTEPEALFGTLEPYLECASDRSSLFVIQRCPEAPLLRLGLLYFGTPLTGVRRAAAPGSLRCLIQRSLTIRIEYGIVSVGVGMDWFVTLQQGELREIPRFERELEAVLSVSGPYRARLDQCPAARAATGEVIREIITTIAQARHGSTLLFGTELSLQDTMHYQPGALQLDLPLGEALLQQWAGESAAEGRAGSDTEATERTAAIVRAVINLSQTDGAVVFDPHLTVIGSSTFLKVKESVAIAGGARRKSAQSFVRAHPGVVAVVISQDGSVSLVG